METKEKEGIYKIQISYSTGNSFGSHDAKDVLEISWNDLNVAKYNLKYIKEHYMMQDDINKNWKQKQTKEQWNEECTDKPWYVFQNVLLQNGCVIDEKDKHKYDSKTLKYVANDDLAQNCIKLYTDNGNVFQISCFWIGYFEQLHSAKIIMNEDNDLEFNV